MSLTVFGWRFATSNWFWIFVAVFSLRNALEWHLTKGRTDGEAGKQTGRGSLGLFVAAYLLCGFGVGAKLLASEPSKLGFIAGCGGFLVLHRVRARIIRQYLSVAWNPYTTPRNGSVLAKSGAYAKIRHPLYLLNFFELACLWVMMPNVVSFAAWMLDLAGTLWRIPGEERLLAASYGKEWDDYRARTFRLVPFVW